MKKQLLSLSAIIVTLTMFVGCKDGVSDNPAEVSTSQTRAQHYQVEQDLYKANHPSNAARVQGLSFSQPSQMHASTK